MVNNLEGLVWDVGDVIVHFDQSIANKKFQQKSTLRITEEEVSAILFGGSASSKEYNVGLTEGYYLGKMDSREFYEAVKKELGLTMTYGEFADAWCEMFEPHTEVIRFIEFAKEKEIPQCVLSSTNPLHMEKMASIGNLRETIGSEQFVTSYNTGIKKPHEDLLVRVERVMGLSRKMLVYIDDIKKYVDAFEGYGIGAGVHVDVKQPQFQQRCIQDVCSKLEIDVPKGF